MSAFQSHCHDLLVLDGQGTTAASSPQIITLALHDAQSPLGSVILAACYQAFVQEYNSISAKEQATTGFQLSVVHDPTTFLSHSLAARPNAVSANLSLYLTQLLRYIAHLNPISFSLSDSCREHALLGFSTGMFAASVIASADS
ncbi:hypothetical protein EUX98_g9388, partial [Antrodiella citrinella]